jgi:hypothetical protein
VFNPFNDSIKILQILVWFNLIGFVVLFYLFEIIGNVPFVILFGADIYTVPFMIFLIAKAILYQIVAHGLLKQKKWARYTTIVLGILMLLELPWTIIGIYFIYGMTKGLPNSFGKTT